MSKNYRSSDKNFIMLQKKFLKSEDGSSGLSTNSKERMKKLLKLQVSYNTHLQSEGLFVMKFHMEYYAFSQLLKSGFNLSDKMESAVQVQH